MSWDQSRYSRDLVCGNVRNDRISRSDLKRCLLLTTALFFMIAPAPDAHDITELTAAFIIPASNAGVAAPGSGG